MKTNKLLATLAACSLSALSIPALADETPLLLSQNSDGLSRDPNNRLECSNKTIEGTYAFVASGTNDGLPTAIARLWDFTPDRNLNRTGTLKGFGPVVTAGTVIQQEFNGTYEIERNCTVMIRFNIFNQTVDGVPTPVTAVANIFATVSNGGGEIIGANVGIIQNDGTRIRPALSVRFQRTVRY